MEKIEASGVLEEALAELRVAGFRVDEELSGCVYYAQLPDSEISFSLEVSAGGKQVLVDEYRQVDGKLDVLKLALYSSGQMKHMAELMLHRSRPRVEKPAPDILDSPIFDPENAQFVKMLAAQAPDMSISAVETVLRLMCAAKGNGLRTRPNVRVEFLSGLVAEFRSGTWYLLLQDQPSVCEPVEGNVVDVVTMVDRLFRSGAISDL